MARDRRWQRRAGLRYDDLGAGHDPARPAYLQAGHRSHPTAPGGVNDVRVFDTTTWAQFMPLPGPNIRSLDIDPTGPRLVTGTVDGGAAIWSIPTGERIHHLRTFGDPVDAVAFARDGAAVAT